MKAVKFLQPDHFQLLKTRLRGLKMDYGAAFEPSYEEEGPAAARLTFRSCLYADVFAKEGAPSLTRFACCQTDRLWLEGAQYRGVDARLSSSIGAGDDACCFVVTRVGG